MQLYTPREIARASGVSIAEVLDALDGRDQLVPHDEAVRVGRRLIGARPAPFAIVMIAGGGHVASLPLAASLALHLLIVAAAAFALAHGATAPSATAGADEQVENMRLVFLTTPGPGGGGGGGGLHETLPAPKALRQGRDRLSSPVPRRQPPAPVTPPLLMPPPITSEVLPAVAAPVISAPADDRDRAGVLQQARAEVDSRGPGQGGGTGTGAGSGLGEGNGAGIGAGSGGGTGGGPFRPGSGIAPPRLMHEVKGDYTDEAQRQGISGDVELEIVIREDGTVGDVHLLHGLGGGLNERAIQAVKQWRFTPATRRGVPVDVVVEVAMEFKLR